MSSRSAVSPCTAALDRAPASVTIEIGGIAVRLWPDKPGFDDVLSTRYAGFLNSHARPWCEFDVSLETPPAALQADIQVLKRGSVWHIKRGDFMAELNLRAGRGWVRQVANPYSIDTVLRVVHTLLLANAGGFLLHASSVVCKGRAFLFSGISGAGKTTISQLAPADAILLTDEISYVRRSCDGYTAHGTPFAGSLEKPGENICAPIAAVYLLEKGTENRMEDVESLTAARSLLRNILFFACDTDLVNRVFESAIEFVSRVPVQRLIFAPDERVWEMIG